MYPSTYLTRAIVFQLLLVLLAQPINSLAQAEQPPGTVQADGIQGREIVGGQAAEPGEWGWQVLVNAGSYLCGGALVAKDWVLTAAHCLFDTQGDLFAPKQITVVAGEYNRRLLEGTEQVLAVAAVYAHENYEKWSNQHDIALLQLAAPAALTDGVVTVPLLSGNALPWAAAGRLATVTGWGITAEDRGPSPVLMEVVVPVVTNEICNRSYGIITSSMLCAGYAEGGMDACRGDSGGPLVVPGAGGSWYLAGIVSFGYGCARANFYGVYTRVSDYGGWIQEGMTTHSTEREEIDEEIEEEADDPILDPELPEPTNRILFLPAVMR